MNNKISATFCIFGTTRMKSTYNLRFREKKKRMPLITIDKLWTLDA